MLSLRTLAPLAPLAPLATLAAAAAAAACADPAPPPPEAEGNLPIEPRFRPLADQIEAERVQLGVAGVAFLVMERGEITFAHGFGVTHPDTGEPVDAGTLFRIGSVTKMLTAAALLQLVDTGQVRLDAPITEYIPQLALDQPPGGAATIRVRDTLVQSSGLFDYIEIDSLHDDGDLDAFLTGPFRSRTYLMAPAGALWNYSNPNFYLAGLALERVGGAPYREAMHDRLFAPLGMHRTTFLGADAVDHGNFAFGVTRRPDGSPLVQAPTVYDNAWARPAGYAFSTVHDLARFVQFLRAGDPAVLSDDQRLAMQRPQRSTKLRRDHGQYGYGLFVEDGFRLPAGYHAQPLVHHGGDIPGFAADVFYLPAADFAVIALANGDGAHFSRSIVHALEHHAAVGPAGPVPADLAIDPATFASLAGNYLDPFNVAGHADPPPPRPAVASRLRHRARRPCLRRAPVTSAAPCASASTRAASSERAEPHRCRHQHRGPACSAPLRSRGGDDLRAPRA
ncbi:MAG TPA: serine hydrolase domain-containing protein, partial [Kofleriaceae bacterium]|nr:serine hydrolase domain-containing protein [Kofleriaceae bacterium]